MAYKLLGFAVWRGAKWYVKRRLPSRRLLVAGAVAAGVVTVAATAGRRHVI